MKLQMHSIHFDADIKLLDFIQKRMDKLETFYDRIIDGEVFLKVENGTKFNNKVVELKVNIPGQTLFSKEQNSSFEAATDAGVEALRRQIRKYKEKQQVHN